jgi:membrane protein required for colicin V production
VIEMTPIDWIIVVVIGVSMLLGLFRGLIREVMSVIGWVLGVVLAIRYAVPLGALMPFEPSMSTASTALAAVLIVLSVVIAAGTVGWLLRKLMKAVEMSSADRMLGSVFGLGRALLILFVVVLFAGQTEAAQQPLWRGSLLLPYAEAAVRFVSPYLPDSLQRQVPDLRQLSGGQG